MELTAGWGCEARNHLSFGIYEGGQAHYGGELAARCRSDREVYLVTDARLPVALDYHLAGEFGDERRPPFLEGGELSPEMFQLAVDLRQFSPRLPFPQVSLTTPGPDQIFDLAAEQPQPWVPVHCGRTILEFARVDRREDLLLGQPVLRASRLVAQRRALAAPFFGAEFHSWSLSPGTELVRPVFAGLPAHELTEAGADHSDVGTGLVLVVPGLSLTQQGLAVLGPGEVRLAQDLRNTASTGCGWAAARRRNGSGPIVSARRYRASRPRTACRT